MKTRAKLMLTAHTEMAYGPDSWRGHEFKFSTQYDPSIPEDQRFAAASPNGSMTIQVDNPTVIEAWSPMLGKQFYLDVTPEDEAKAMMEEANPAAEGRRKGNESAGEGNE